MLQRSSKVQVLWLLLHLKESNTLLSLKNINNIKLIFTRTLIRPSPGPLEQGSSHCIEKIVTFFVECQEKLN